MTLDRYLSRTRRPGYDCRTFAREVWRELTGEDVELSPADRRHRVKLEQAVDPCLVLMRGHDVHVGVFTAGRVLHLREAAEHVPLCVAALGFQSVEFYR